MGVLRIGTRGSDLALAQTRWVCARLREQDPRVELREVVVRTHGDEQPEVPIDEHWPAGGFVAAIERALLDGRIDFAVHSLKDLPSEKTAGLTVAAIPEREVAHDVLVLREPVRIESLPAGFRIGFSSPRRAAQFRRFASVEVVSIRGNVQTRLSRMERENLDGVVLAAAGLRRLHIRPPHVIPLPINAFLPAPGQGALAVQVREGDNIESRVARLEHVPSRLRIEAERALLGVVGAGCHTPVAALAVFRRQGNGADCVTMELSGQLFENVNGTRMAEGTRSVSIEQTIGNRERAMDVGRSLGRELMAELASSS